MQAFNFKKFLYAIPGIIFFSGMLWLVSCNVLGPDEFSDDILITDETGRELGGDHSDWCKDGNSNGDNFILKNSSASGSSAQIDSLKLSQDSNKITVSWITVSESHCKRFNLERMKSGNSVWDTVKKSNCLGGISTTGRYKLIDTLTSTGTYYYRIRQIDSNLSFSIYSVPGSAYYGIGIVNTTSSSFSFGAAYPNPASAEVHIRFDLPRSTNVKIYWDNDDVVMNENKSAGSYEILLNKSQFGFSNEVRRIYMEAGDFHCYGDIQFR